MWIFKDQNILSGNTGEKKIWNVTGLCPKIPTQQKYEYTWDVYGQ